MLQRSNNTGLFRYFKPFFRHHNFLPLTGMKFCLPLAFLLRQQELYHPAGEQQAFGENRLFIGNVPIVVLLWAPARKLEYFSDFGSFWCCWLASLKSRKHLVSRFWLPTTAVWYTRRRHTPPPGASLNFAGRGCLWGAVAAR